MSTRAGDPISVEQGYAALFWFLHAYWERGRSEEISFLLSNLQMAADGTPMDPAMTADWLTAVERARREPPPRVSFRR